VTGCEEGGNGGKKVNVKGAIRGESAWKRKRGGKMADREKRGERRGGETGA